MFDLPREEVANLLPCAICSAPFDPATLPSHIYDPNQNFLLFSRHTSICPSCFAEELAKRSRPDPDTLMEPDDVPTTVQRKERALEVSSGAFRPGYTFHKKASSLATIHKSAFARAGEEVDISHRRASSSINFSRAGPVLKRESRSYDVLRRQDSLRESNTSYETYRHRPSTSIGHSTTSQKTSPELPSRIHRTSPEIPQRVGSRNHSRAQTIQSSPDLSRISQDKTAVSNRPSVELTRKSIENVRRKVSFHKGTPVAQSFNPQSPPYHAATRLAMLPGSGSQSATELEQKPPAHAQPMAVADASQAETHSHRLSSLFNRRHPHTVVEESTPSSFLSWSSWRIRRRQDKEVREHRWQRRKEQQRMKKVREERERGIGLDLFCPHCQEVVNTTPKWRDGSCCMLYSACLFACTGPLCLCLLLPCASRQVLDVDGRCPNCATTLSTWNRRKNQLTILTWAGPRRSTGQVRNDSLAPRPRPERTLERTSSARLPSTTSPTYVHYSRPRTATTTSQSSRARNDTLSSVPPSAAPRPASSVSRPRTTSSAQRTVTATATTTSTARNSGGSPPTTTRSSPSSRMAASATGTTSSSGRTGSSSNRTAVSTGTGTTTGASASTANTLINAGPVPMTTASAILYEEEPAALSDDEGDGDAARGDRGSRETDIVATDFAAFLQDPVGQGYLHDNHAITHAALGHAVQIIVPQHILDEIEMDEVGRAIG